MKTISNYFYLSNENKSYLNIFVINIIVKKNAYKICDILIKYRNSNFK